MENIVLGKTRDDAAGGVLTRGENSGLVSRPNNCSISSKLSGKIKPMETKTETSFFTQTNVKTKDYDFSFGFKLLFFIVIKSYQKEQKLKECFAFELEAITDVLVENLKPLKIFLSNQ